MADKEDKFDTIANLPFMKVGSSSINEALDLAPVEFKKYVVEMREDRNDLETVREELHDILSGLKTSFYAQLEQAAQVPLPRAHEVIATTAEKRINAATALQELYDQMNQSPDPEDAKVINGSLMISSAEMLDMIKSVQEKKEEK